MSDLFSEIDFIDVETIDSWIKLGKVFPDKTQRKKFVVDCYRNRHKKSPLEIKELERQLNVMYNLGDNKLKILLKERN